MMIDFSFLIIPSQSVNVGVQKNLKEGEEKHKYQPNVDHFDVGGFWQALIHRDEHSGQNLRK